MQCRWSSFVFLAFGMILLTVTNVLNGQRGVSDWIFFFPLNCLKSFLPFKQWALSSNTKEKGQTRCCIQSHSCGQGKRRAKRMPVGFAMESEWTKTLSQASLFLASRQQWPFFFFSSSLSPRLSERMEEEEETCMVGKNCDGNSPRAHRHSLEGFIPNRFRSFFRGTSKNILEKDQLLRNKSLYEVSFTLIADLVCYATCREVIVSLLGQVWHVSLLSTMETLLY